MYALDLSPASLVNRDLAPLYAESVNDPRLGASERDALTRAFRTLDGGVPAHGAMESANMLGPRL